LNAFQFVVHHEVITLLAVIPLGWNVLVEGHCHSLGCQNIEVSVILFQFQFVCVCRVTSARDTLSEGVQNGDGTPGHTTDVFAPSKETELRRGR